jgi:hypothetical protein
MNEYDEYANTDINRAAVDRACDKFLMSRDPRYKARKDEMRERMLKSHAVRNAAKQENFQDNQENEDDTLC